MPPCALTVPTAPLRSLALVAISALVLASCGGGGGEEGPATPAEELGSFRAELVRELLDELGDLYTDGTLSASATEEDIAAATHRLRVAVRRLARTRRDAFRIRTGCGQVKTAVFVGAGQLGAQEYAAHELPAEDREQLIVIGQAYDVLGVPSASGPVGISSGVWVFGSGCPSQRGYFRNTAASCTFDGNLEALGTCERAAV